MCATARDIKVRDIIIDIHRPKLNMAAYKMKSATKTSIYNCYLLCTGTNLEMFVFLLGCPITCVVVNMQLKWQCKTEFENFVYNLS